MRRCSQCLLAVMIVFSVAAAVASEHSKAKGPSPLALAQGDVSEFKIAANDVAEIQAQMNKQPVFFYPSETGGFAALIAVDVMAKPGLVQLEIKFRRKGAAEQRIKIPVKITARQFHEESFNVAPGFDDMSPETLEEIRREQEAFTAAFAAGSPARFWDFPFIRPVPQEASASSFGSRRIINGVPRAPHTGTDLSAPAGTEVVAVNHGRVVLVGNFFFAGGTVVVDHGAGLFSMYFHLSEFKVDEGTTVRRGDVLALSGATGRVTGPHLHWGMRLNNMRVDPLRILEKFSSIPGQTKAAIEKPKTMEHPDIYERGN